MENVLEKGKKLRAVIEAYKQEHGELPSLEQIGKLLCIPVSVLKDCFANVLKECGIN